MPGFFSGGKKIVQKVNKPDPCPSGDADWKNSGRASYRKILANSNFIDQTDIL
jgi:hypothetical protein